MAKQNKKDAAGEASAAPQERKLKIPTGTFGDSKGNEYRFTAASFVLDGQTHVAEDLLKTKTREAANGKTEEYHVGEEILAKLVSIKAGVITLVEEGGE